MKLTSYYYEGKLLTGVLNEEKDVIVSTSEILELKEELSMNNLIDNWNEDIEDKLKNYKNYAGIAKSDVKLDSPIPYPKRVLCIGKNYVDHVKEFDAVIKTEDGIPKAPIFFAKQVNKALGPDEAINSHPNITDDMDYEVELAVIIGKDGINISKEDAEEYIFGYSVLNDVTARNLQAIHLQWLRGKGLDDTCPLGPVIVTKDDITIDEDLKITLKVNDEIRQNSSTGHMIWGVAEMIEELSKGLTLKKGDIIATGTPSGVGLSFTPGKFLKAGDIVECSIKKIGTIINPVK